MKELLTHDVRLCSNCNQPVYMLADGYQHLTRHVSTLLRAWGLVFDVDARSSLLDEQLGQLHDGSETAMASVCIGNDGSEIVNILQAATLRLGCRQALLTLFAVMKQLCHEEVGYFVGYSGLPTRGEYKESNFLRGKKVG